jgi:hypothetical protein
MAEVGEENVFVCEDEMKRDESCMFEDSGVNVGSLNVTQGEVSSNQEIKIVPQVHKSKEESKTDEEMDLRESVNMLTGKMMISMAEMKEEIKINSQVMMEQKTNMNEMQKKQEEGIIGIKQEIANIKINMKNESKKNDERSLKQEEGITNMKQEMMKKWMMIVRNKMHFMLNGWLSCELIDKSERNKKNVSKK